jgi:hypothetical protein
MAAVIAALVINDLRELFFVIVLFFFAERVNVSGYRLLVTGYRENKGIDNRAPGNR